MNPIDTNTASVDQMRDWCAREDGWTFEPTERGDALVWARTDANGNKSWCDGHPHDTGLDGADKAMPEGWTWTRSNGYWHAYPSPVSSSRITICDTGDKARDLWRLVALCRLAAKEKTR